MVMASSVFTKRIVELQQSIQPSDPMVLTIHASTAASAYDARYSTTPLALITTNFFANDPHLHTSRETLFTPHTINTNLDFLAAVLFG